MSAVGTPSVRTDGAAKVRGSALYGVDYAEAGMLHAKLLRSPVPAGRIRTLDVEAARAVPGVRAVVAAVDAPRHLAGAVIRDQRLFADDVVRYEGEPIAAVVADSEHAAREALRAIRLELDETPAVTLENALGDGAPLVHPEWPSYEQALPGELGRHGNVATRVLSDRDPEARTAAFASAHRVVEGEYRASRQYQAYLEPKSAVARYDGGRYEIHDATQYPFNVRTQTAEALGVRVSDVRVVGHHVGGAFGAKLDASLEPYAALCARLVGAPVRIANERVEDLLTCGSRENGLVRLRTALAQDGTILAREFECLMDNGAYSGEMPFLASLPMHVVGQVYRTGPALVDTRLVYTNTAPTGAFRGVSGTYLYFAIERHMDECARALGLDRRELRLRNLIDDGARSLVDQVLEDAGLLREAFERCEEVAPWAEAEARRGRTPAGRLRGVGIAAVTWLTNPSPAAVTMKLNEDGTVGLVTGATENGSGAVSMGITQIAADELGVRPEDVVVVMPDTDSAGYDGGSQGSRTTHVAGRATRIAGAEVRRKVLDVASQLMEVADDDLELEEGTVRVKGSPDRAVTLAQVALAALWTTGPIAGTGSYVTPTPQHDPSCASGLLFPTFPTPSYHVHLAEVEVDPGTGQVDVVRYVVVQEVGATINPEGLRGQIQGGVAQGLGYALYETLEIGEDARYRQRTLETYRLPLAVDVPEVEFVILEHPEAAGPYGARGVAEPPIVPVAAVIGNAVSDAIGRPVDAIPIRPDDVLDALAAPA